MRYLIAVTVIMASMQSVVMADPVKWDYVKNPVVVTENRPAAFAVLGMMAQSAFDGYGALGDKPACVRGWQQTNLPSDAAPISCDIDYGKPVAVSGFVNYCYVPVSRDLRYTSPAPSTFKRVKILVSDDNINWTAITTLNDLPPFCPQILPVNASSAYRYWRIEVIELAKGAEFLLSYEIETYTGGVPTTTAPNPVAPDFLGDFTKHVKSFKPATQVLRNMVSPGDKDSFMISFDDAEKSQTAHLNVLVDNAPVRIQPQSGSQFYSLLPDGRLEIRFTKTKMGILADFSYHAADTNPVKYRRVTLAMSVDAPDVYYMPAYAWNKKPVDVLANTCNVQTRFAALSKGNYTMSLALGTDRGTLGFINGEVNSNLLIGAEPTPMLISGIKGDWMAQYRFAVEDIYQFDEQPQSVPVSEIQYGISRFMMSDEVWEPTLGTVKSWPERDPHTKLVGTDMFSFYGATYSIPTYWARYVMNDDKMALERCRSVALWMVRSGLHLKSGPLKGAFFNLVRYSPGEKIDISKQGATQANTQMLTTQSTGTALWTLLFYRKMTGDKVGEIDAAIDDAAKWLIDTQSADGSWPYAFDLNGKVVPGASSSGCIWNIWALWRLAKETGNPVYRDSVNRATKWFAKEFVDNHHYHGYWEDVGPDCREGYEAAVAAVAFGEMGEKDLAVQTARDAVQWVYTRQIEPREKNNSAGLAAEQTGWQPATYCNPMMGLAAWTAWQITGDDFWKPLALINKAIGWWYQPETGAMVWIVDSTQMAPIVGPSFESWWSDWCIAQVGTLSLRWLTREASRYSGGKLAINEESLAGKFLDKDVKAWTPPGGFHPALPAHSQVNWLGFKDNKSVYATFMNYSKAGDINCMLDSRAVNGAAIRPVSMYVIKGESVSKKAWDGSPVNIAKDGMLVLEWEYIR
ncbi:MAG: hypothetical protein ACYC0V_11395 [Armatimonadota bacterium]